MTPASARATLAVGIVRLTAGRGISVALNFIGWALMARALGPDSFGVLQFAISVVFFVSFATDLGLTTYGTREVAASTHPYRVVRTIIGLRIVLAVAATSLALLVVLLLPAQGEQRTVLLVVGSVVAAGAVNLLWLLRAQGRSASMALQDVASAAVLAGGALLLVGPTGSVVVAATVYAGAQWLAAGLSIRAVGGLAGTRPDLDAGWSILRAALPLGVAVLAVNVYYTADSVILGIVRTSAEVGWYGAAYRLVTPWLMLASVAGLLAMPTLTGMHHRAPDEVHRTLSGLSRILLAIGLPVAVTTTIASEMLVTLVFGESYLPAAEPLRILIWSCVTVYANAPFAFLMLARRQDRAYMWIAVSGAVLNLALNAALTPGLGMVGAATATIVAEIVVLAAMLWATRDTSIGILARSVPPAMLVAVVTGVAAWPVRESVLALPVAAIAFLVTGAVTRAIPIRQLLPLMGRASRMTGRDGR